MFRKLLKGIVELHVSWGKAGGGNAVRAGDLAVKLCESSRMQAADHTWMCRETAQPAIL
jgi:hypothetical protein